MLLLIRKEKSVWVNLVTDALAQPGNFKTFNMFSSPNEETILKESALHYLFPGWPCFRPNAPGINIFGFIFII